MLLPVLLEILPLLKTEAALYGVLVSVLVHMQMHTLGDIDDFDRILTIVTKVVQRSETVTRSATLRFRPLLLTAGRLIFDAIFDCFSSAPVIPFMLKHILEGGSPVSFNSELWYSYAEGECGGEEPPKEATAMLPSLLRVVKPPQEKLGNIVQRMQKWLHRLLAQLVLYDTGFLDLFFSKAMVPGSGIFFQAIAELFLPFQGIEEFLKHLKRTMQFPPSQTARELNRVFYFRIGKFLALGFLYLLDSSLRFGCSRSISSRTSLWVGVSCRTIPATAQHSYVRRNGKVRILFQAQLSFGFDVGLSLAAPQRHSGFRH
jgi:hypothetical protein